MRWILIALFLSAAACDSDEPADRADAGFTDAGASSLPLPGSMPRPPSGGLPADLRPPR